MRKKKRTLLSIAIACWLGVSGAAQAADKIYYGQGDGENAGDISNVNWVLNNDYQYYGGHQWFYTAYTKDGTAANNTLTINGGSYKVNGAIVSASDKYSNYFYGGLAGNSGSATGNRIIINNGNFINESGTWQAAGIYAAQAKGKGYVASDNSAQVNGGTFQGYTYISAGLGYNDSDAVKNTVEVNGGDFEKGVYIFGGRGYTKGNTDNNTVVVNGGKIGGYKAFIWGGKADDGDARYNTVKLSGGAVASIPAGENIQESEFTKYEQGDAEFYGGYTLNGNALYNTVNISGGAISTDGTGLVYGGYSRTGNANYNRVDVSGGSISSKLTLLGGFAAGGDARGNTIRLTGGSGNGEVYLYGGMTLDSAKSATDNKIAIYFPAQLKDIYGGVYLTGNGADGYVYNLKNDGDLFTGNELYLAAPGISAKNIYNFEKLSFYLPSTYRVGGNMLTLTGTETADLTNTKIAVSAAGDAPLSSGQTINLISTQGAFNYGSQTEGTLKRGVSLNYRYTLKKDANNLQAVLGEAETTDEAKSPVETRAAQTAFLNRGADLLISDGLFQAEQASKTEEGAKKNEWSPFFAVQGGKYRYQTGSHIDSRGFNAVLGMAREIKSGNGKLLYGFAGEYGKGSYDSYCGNMSGKGDNNYGGATIFVRQKSNEGTYYEGSLRAGRTKADYSSRDFTGYEGKTIGYDTGSGYFGAHLGLGKMIKLSDQNEADVSLKYFYSHIGGDSTRLTTGETYRFSAVNSHRLRLGAKLFHAFNAESKGYFGAYYEHEFGGDARASVAGYGTGAPSLKGNSGIFEIGFLHRPKNSNFTLSLGISAACGKQRGVAGKVGMMWKL